MKTKVRVRVFLATEFMKVVIQYLQIITLITFLNNALHGLRSSQSSFPLLKTKKVIPEKNKKKQRFFIFVGRGNEKEMSFQGTFKRGDTKKRAVV